MKMDFQLCISIAEAFPKISRVRNSLIEMETRMMIMVHLSVKGDVSILTEV